jgi:hypothetical protein
MATAVDICNLALAHLGDRATVSSIDPPEGSAQAEHCARFYPMARDLLLTKHLWGFTTVRSLLAQLTNNSEQWAYTYAVPNDLMSIIAVIESDATSDYSVAIPVAYTPQNVIGFGATVYTPQPFALERDAGVQVIRTNVENALCRYTTRIVDPAQFDAMFTEALSYLLASYLAGPILKGSVGTSVGRTMRQTAEALLADAKSNDSENDYNVFAHSIPWMAGR